MGRIRKSSEGTLAGWAGRDGGLEVGWEGPAQPGTGPLPPGQDGGKKKRRAALLGRSQSPLCPPPHSGCDHQAVTERPRNTRGH